MIKHKDINQYNKNVKKVFDLISWRVDNPIVMGSNYEKQSYAHDFDLFEIIYTCNILKRFKTNLKKKFSEIGRRIKKDPNIFFISFQAGVTSDDSDENKTKEELEKENAIFWTLNSLIKGEIKIDGIKYSLSDIIDHQSIIKIDVVAIIDNLFVPFSNVFEIRYHNGVGINRQMETRDTKESIIKDIHKYKKRGNYWKVLKRLYIIAKIDKDVKSIQMLQDIFNSDIGRLSQIKGDVEAIKDVLDVGYSGGKLNGMISNALQIIKSKLSLIKDFHINKKIYTKINALATRKRFAATTFIKLTEELNEKLQKETKQLTAYKKLIKKI